MRYRRPRYNRRRPSARGRNERIGFNAVLLILIAAVIAGYLTTRFVLYPLLGFEFPSLETIWDKYRPSVSEDKNSNKDRKEDSRSETKEQKTIVEDKKDASEEGYVIQFGSFSTKAAAKERTSELKDEGIKTSVIEKDDCYKVVGEIFSTKDKAKTAMADIDYDGVFVTELK